MSLAGCRLWMGWHSRELNAKLGCQLKNLNNITQQFHLNEEHKSDYNTLKIPMMFTHDIS